MTYRVRNLVIAIVFAIVAVTITVSYATSYKSSVDSQSHQVRVLVAARDIPVGTPGASLVSGGYVTPTSVAKSMLVPNAIGTIAKVRGKSVQVQIDKGEQITTRRFASLGSTGVQTQLAGKLRAVQLGGDSNQLLAGTLEAGEHVDFVASLANPEGSQNHYTRIIARNLLVLDAPSKGGGGTISNSSGSRSVVLAMTDIQAQDIFHVVKWGQWSLALRPVMKPRSSNGEVETNTSILTNHGRQAGLLQR